MLFSVLLVGFPCAKLLRSWLLPIMDFTDPPVLTSRVVTPKYVSVGLGSEVPVPKNPSEAQAEPPKRETKEIRLQAVSVSGHANKGFP